MTAKKTLSCQITYSPTSYEIDIGHGVRTGAFDFSERFSHQSVIITTAFIDTAFHLPAKEKILLPATETIKSRATKEKIENFLMEKNFGKETLLIAIGGGALLDLVGFAAATYCRGIPFISLPTTLLAMTDAAIGGKTGINVEEAKNWIGAFHHPLKIFSDLDFLQTLPEKEFRLGLSETIKHSLVADAELFYFLEKNVEGILQREPVLIEMIARSCEVKKMIVEKDPSEREGLRKILNFGHTIGHALETFSKYQCPHGQAVAMGIGVEAALAHRMGHLPAEDLGRIEDLLAAYNLRFDYPKNLPYELLQRDKKGAYQFVVLSGIGSVARCEGKYTMALSKEDFRMVWENALCSA